MWQSIIRIPVAVSAGCKVALLTGCIPSSCQLDFCMAAEEAARGVSRPAEPGGLASSDRHGRQEQLQQCVPGLSTGRSASRCDAARPAPLVHCCRGGYLPALVVSLQPPFLHLPHDKLDIAGPRLNFCHVPHTLYCPSTEKNEGRRGYNFKSGRVGLEVMRAHASCLSMMLPRLARLLS